MPAFNILVVDDDPGVRRILVKILTRVGYNVFEAETGGGALAVSSSEAIDLVLLDFLLPDMDGIQVAQKMLSTNPCVPIILLTGHGTISRAVEATKLGVYDFLEKPPDRDHILISVRNALAHGTLEKKLVKYQQEALARFKMVGQSPAMQRVFELVERMAAVDVPVLITGENGVGKELVAAAIHQRSSRANKAMVKLNCAAIPEEIVESELFGHTKGAFTSAFTARQGRLAAADGSSLLLDEIGDLSLSAQAKILRFLESGEIQKVGSSEIHQVNVRLMAATNMNLEKAVEEKRFRQDLFYRINVVRINVPPLRSRPDDIPLLVEHFTNEFAEQLGRNRPHYSPAVYQYLQGYNWPGNVRELRHFVERTMILVPGDLIDIQNVRPLLEHRAEQTPSVFFENLPLNEARKNFEREYILRVLEENNGCMSAAAKTLCVDRANLYRRLRDLGIE